MKDRQRELTRRQVLAGGAGLTLAGLAGSSRALGASSPAEVESRAAAKSRVVLIRRQEVLLENGQIDSEVLHEMLNGCVQVT